MMIARARAWAKRIKRDVLALWVAARDARTPWEAKAVAAAVAAYALSPLDLIPDFIPVLGYLDDLVLVPLGILLAVSLIPPPLMAEFRARADRLAERPVSRGAAMAVIGIWLVSLGVLTWAVWSSQGWGPIRRP
jgi:uncharacterized membrane protein YkvA (DUF1232 family)